MIYSIVYLGLDLVHVQGVVPEIVALAPEVILALGADPVVEVILVADLDTARAQDAPTALIASQITDQSLDRALGLVKVKI